jgi:hypothetical protein
MGTLQGFFLESLYQVVPEDRQIYCSHVATLEKECDENAGSMGNVMERLIISLDSSDKDDVDKWRES